MQRPPNDERAPHIADFLPPDADLKERMLVAKLHRLLGATEPPPTLSVRIRTLAQGMARQSPHRTGIQAHRLPVLRPLSSPSTASAHIPSRRNPLRVIAGTLAALLVVGLLAMTYLMVLSTLDNQHRNSPGESGLPASQPSNGGSPAIGRLALALGNRIVVDGAVWIEDGGVSSPAWSSSGRWLAYQKDSREGTTIVIRDTQSDRRTEFSVVASTPPVPSAGALPPESLFAWSPVADLLLLRSVNGGLFLHDPAGTGPDRPVIHGPVESFAWAPDGRQIALVRSRSATSVPEGELVLLSLEDYQERTVYQAKGTSLHIAAWWPDGHGLLVWELPLASMSLATDGVPLRSVDLATGTVATLATMQPERSLLTWGPPTAESPTVFLIAGEGREYWSSTKALLRCAVRLAQCTPVELPRADVVPVSLSWSPNTGRLALVVAPMVTAPALEPASWATWVAAHQLLILDAEGTPSDPVPHELQDGVLQAAWAAPDTLLVLQALPDGHLRLIKFDTGNGKLHALADLTGYGPETPIEGHGAPALQLEWIAAWHA